MEVIVNDLTEQGIKLDNIGFIGEENLCVSGDHTFIIDPLDGTTNYISKIKYFGVSIAYAYLGKITSSVVLNPTNNELFWAQKEKGSYINCGKTEKKLKVDKTKLTNCLMNTYFSADDQLSTQMFNTTQKLASFIRGIRSLGSGVMESVDFCQNKLGILLYNSSWIWDLAATQLIIEEAGGTMVNWQGEKIKFDFTKADKRYPNLVTHPNLVSEIIKIIDITADH
ncbi:hypothetical protein KKA15_02835 [Patescibacteria group bacterium]|nr:hypothetical protein [Patescibacteria group bacterium]